MEITSTLLIEVDVSIHDPMISPSCKFCSASSSLERIYAYGKNKSCGCQQSRAGIGACYRNNGSRERVSALGHKQMAFEWHTSTNNNCKAPCRRASVATLYIVQELLTDGEYTHTYSHIRRYTSHSQESLGIHINPPTCAGYTILRHLPNSVSRCERSSVWRR